MKSDSRAAPEPVDLTVITALYNCLDLTREYLDSLKKTLNESGIRYEVILIDDCSTDGTREFLQTLGAPYRVFLNEMNCGYAANNNRGAGEANGRILAFLNNDLILTPGWIEPMLAGLEQLDDSGIIGNIQLDPATGLIDHAGVFFDPNGLPAHARKGRKKRPKGDFKEWYAVTAACILIRRPVFLENGGFDESYINGTEDIDLCVRLRQKGYRHYVANNSIIYHHVSSSPDRTKHDDQNMRRFHERWSYVTVEWGKREWAVEYLRRYARRWWRYNFTKFWRAVWLVATRREL